MADDLYGDPNTQKRRPMGPGAGGANFGGGPVGDPPPVDPGGGPDYGARGATLTPAGGPSDPAPTPDYAARGATPGDIAGPSGPAPTPDYAGRGADIAGGPQIGLGGGGANGPMLPQGGDIAGAQDTSLQGQLATKLGAGGQAPQAPTGDLQGALLGGGQGQPGGQGQQPGPPQSLDQTFQSALLQKLNPGAVTTNTPEVKGLIDANSLAEQRGLERQRNLLAEQAAKNGTDASGGFQTDLMGLEADRAAREGGFNANAVSKVSDRQNQNLMQALGLTGDTLNQQAGRAQQESQFGRSLGQQNTQFNQSLGMEEAKRLQQENQFGRSLGLEEAKRLQQGGQFDKTLAEQQRQSAIDAELKRLGINSQTDLGGRDIDLRKSLGEQQGKLGLLGLLLNQDQFGRSLDQNAAQFGQSQDTNSLLGLLGLL